MTAPQDAPAGPVLGDDRRAFEQGVRGVLTLSLGHTDLRDTVAATIAASPALMFLLSSAREEGAAAERERIAELILDYGHASECGAVYETCAEIVRSGSLPS